MDPSRIDRLTDGQRACLRLVFDHRSSKEIARSLGISSHTVDQRLKAAMRILGVESRVEAARALALAEGRTGCQPLVYQEPDIAAATALEGRPAPTEGPDDRSTAVVMREEQVPYRLLPPEKTRSFFLPLPIGEGQPGDLKPLHRLAWIVGIMLAAALTFGVFVAGIEALSRLGRALSN